MRLRGSDDHAHVVRNKFKLRLSYPPRSQKDFLKSKRSFQLSMENQVNPHSSWRRAIKIVSAFVLLSPAVLNAQQYQQTNLLSNTLMEANAPDANLKNPWGIARGTGAPWWISDNAAGVSTLYNGAGVKQPLTVTIPHTANTTIGNPTGIVFNASSDFDVATGMPADFIFASLDGTISAWNPGVNPTNA